MTSEPNDLDRSVKIEIIPQSSEITPQTSDRVENDLDTSIKIEIIPQTSDLVETEMAGESDDLKSETKALIDALKKRAQAEAQSAGTLTREAYLNAVRRARETLEQTS